MIRLKAKRRFRISNRLALVGALTLALTLFTGANEPGQLDLQPNLSASTESHSHGNTAAAAERSKRFSISRMLFGHG
ncbi:MAG: hypothetical protein ACO3KY_09750 [Lysobacterales bacterium]